MVQKSTSASGFGVRNADYQVTVTACGCTQPYNLLLLMLPSGFRRVFGRCGRWFLRRCGRWFFRRFVRWIFRRWNRRCQSGLLKVAQTLKYSIILQKTRWPTVDDFNPKLLMPASRIIAPLGAIV